MKNLKKVVNVLSILAVGYVGYLAISALWKVDVLLALATGCLYVLEVLRNVAELIRNE
jgi:glucose uptake protein GlcU